MNIEQLLNKPFSSLTSQEQTLVLEFHAEKMKASKAARTEERKQVFSIKVSELGAVQVEGLGSRFPTTLYVEQWKTVKEHMAEIEKFGIDNAALIAERRANAPEVRKQRKALEKARKQVLKIASSN